MSETTGIVVDGPARGKIITAYPPAVWQVSDPGMYRGDEKPEESRIFLWLHRCVLAGRVYWVWSTRHAGRGLYGTDIANAAVLALIDADPADAEKCRDRSSERVNI